MWTSTLELSFRRVLPTQLLGLFWQGAYFSSLAPLQVRNLPRRPLPREHGNWVRVHNRLAGICGSDLHQVFVNGEMSIAPAALPAHGRTYPGHEVVGEVVEIGDQVQSLQVGDRVVLQSGPSCLSADVHPLCHSCAGGHYSVCENGNLPGPGQIGGGWSEEMLLHEQQLFHIPDEMEDEQAVLLEPSAVAVHTVLRHLPAPGDRVLIVGAGTIGLLTLQVVRALAPQAEVSVMARYDFQVEQATRMGAAHILYGRDSYESVEKVTGATLYKGMLGNKMLLGGYDVIYDTVGTHRTIHDCLRWARAKGTVVLVGLSLYQMKLDLSPLWYQEVSLLGSIGHGMERWPLGTTQERSTFAVTTDLITHGLLHPEKLVTHHFALSNFREALRTAMGKKENRAIKVVFDATLLPASSVPNSPLAARSRFPLFKANAAPLALDEDGEEEPQFESLLPTSGPSHFTMSQSEDFTADFDSTLFVGPRTRRPPTALQFQQAGHESASSSEPNGPVTATNTDSPALEDVEESANDAMSDPHDDA